eukprot:CAMPEP_0205946650 /NCGR_PEP_ID=MMETSP1325-20131115/69147_1 /ASSEMBLY_ACC=CAM_ASM_000708 /TAXON_ID=236786 /ORGANISM="Florenciella sp., Strain RCC1007" /LENGTH=392 /DNA_ID=CAMNT_0053317739 /DNA_START=62 /DNA_END=1240 /DNA_ORIENTATION=-
METKAESSQAKERKSLSPEPQMAKKSSMRLEPIMKVTKTPRAAAPGSLPPRAYLTHVPSPSSLTGIHPHASKPALVTRPLALRTTAITQSSESLRVYSISSRDLVSGTSALETSSAKKKPPVKSKVGIELAEALPESTGPGPDVRDATPLPVDEIVRRVTRELDRRLGEQRKVLEDQLAAQRLLLEARIVAQETEMTNLRDKNEHQAALIAQLKEGGAGRGALAKRKRPPTDKEYLDNLYVEDLYAYRRVKPWTGMSPQRLLLEARIVAQETEMTNLRDKNEHQAALIAQLYAYRRVKPWTGMSRICLYLFYLLYGPVGCCLVVVRLILLLTCLAILHILPKQCRATFCISFVYPFIIPLCGVWATSTNSRHLEKVSGPKVVVINHTSNFDP